MARKIIYPQISTGEGFKGAANDTLYYGVLQSPGAFPTKIVVNSYSLGVGKPANKPARPTKKKAKKRK